MTNNTKIPFSFWFLCFMFTFFFVVCLYVKDPPDTFFSYTESLFFFANSQFKVFFYFFFFFRYKNEYIGIPTDLDLHSHTDTQTYIYIYMTNMSEREPCRWVFSTIRLIRHFLLFQFDVSVIGNSLFHPNHQIHIER